ncbi:MAG: DUF2892 domain-containing protein [Verrucomicrobia bacterium]|nr:DUF2892 domain-containing protein [Verrucomicrobiota bacterium]
MLPPTATRVEHSTSDEINAKIENETRSDIARAASAGLPAISRRLRELDHEWNVERTLEANAATLILVSIGLGLTTDRRWFAFPGIIAGFLLQHALQGWCPPLPVLRHLGIRTAREIELERTALRLLRGDFASATQDADEAFRVAQQSLA